MNVKEAKKITAKHYSDALECNCAKGYYPPCQEAEGFLAGREAGIKEAAEILKDYNPEFDTYKVSEKIISLLNQEP